MVISGKYFPIKQTLSESMLSTQTFTPTPSSSKTGMLLTPAFSLNAKARIEIETPIEENSTLADGNCAMNAVALGICDLLNDLPQSEISTHNNNKSSEGSLSDNLYKYLWDIVNVMEPLIQKATGLSTSTWLQKEKNPNQRQLILASVVRGLAVQTIESHYHDYKETYEAGLLAAFEQFKLNQFDETFSVHTHIRQKFVELCNVPNLPLQNEESSGHNKDLQDKKIIADRPAGQKLIDWWNTGVNEGLRQELPGRKTYFDQLKLPARGVFDRERWGSEVEIGALAFRLGISIKSIKRAPMVGIASREEQLLGIGYGFMPSLKTQEIEHLVNLGLGSKFQNGFRIEIASHAELNRRLNLETLSALERQYLDENGKQSLLSFINSTHHDNPNLPNQPVPAQSASHTPEIKELREFCEKLKRIGVLQEKSHHQGLRFINDTAFKYRATPVAEELKKKVLEAHCQPLMFSIEHEGQHWSYRGSIAKPIDLQQLAEWPENRQIREQILFAFKTYKPNFSREITGLISEYAYKHGIDGKY